MNDKTCFKHVKISIVDNTELVVEEFDKFPKKDLSDLNNWYNLSGLEKKKKEEVI